MAGKSPPQAVRAFLEPLQLALSCVTRAVVVASAFSVDDPIGVITVGRGERVALRSRDRFSLSAMVKYRIIAAGAERGPWKVSTVAYYYAIHDRKGREILAYHWHPAETRGVQYPHLHLGAGSEAIQTLSSAHLPTGRIALEQVLHLLIGDFRVKPQRRDWERVLAETRTAFEKYRTW